MHLAGQQAEARRRARNRLLAILCALGLLLPAASLQADDSPPVSPDPPAVFEIASEDDFLLGLPSVSEDELSGIRGGEGTAISLQDMQASVDGNSISGNVTTGGVSIGENAFTDLDGISSVVVNSGNNVSIQSSTVINVVIDD